jgi:hypothetical protein
MPVTAVRIDYDRFAAAKRRFHFLRLLDASGGIVAVEKILAAEAHERAKDGHLHRITLGDEPHI